MSYEYTTFENKIPIVEKYINDVYSSSINVLNYLGNNKNYNYFVLEPSYDNTKTSYILRVKSPIKNHQIFTCAAGGHGGLIYGKGGNGGNYLYIDNTNETSSISSKELAIGSYLIIPGKAIDVISILENSIEYNQLLSAITLNSSFYLIKYNNNNFNNYKLSLDVLDNYKKRNWAESTDNTTGEIITIKSLYQNKTNKVNNFNNTIRTIELIFYLKKNKTFRFNEFTNPNYTRIIRISNNININVQYDPSINDNYIYKAGDYDEIISIICYPNSSSINIENQIDWTTLFDLDYANSSLNNNFYIYDFNKKKEINDIDGIIYNISNQNNDKNTYIFYNINPDASLNQLKQKMNRYYLGLQGGVDGDINNISYNDGVNINIILKRFYMPYLFSVQNLPNLFGGTAGSTFASNFGNIIINKLGGSEYIKLKEITPRNIQINQNTKEWISGSKGLFSTNFKINAYYPRDQNTELNNNSLSNGGYSGYWQFIKDEANYNYGANGINDLNSPNYGTYGCGGQGGSVLIDKNSKFTGSKGKDGVFILSFLNYAIATIVNDNSNVIKKMYKLFIKNNNKIDYIDKLSDNNIINNNNSIIVDLNNTFIHEANIHIDDAYINKLQSFINKSNLINLLVSVYIIQRTYFLISENINNININNISILEIYFINDINKEKIETNDKSNILKIYLYDKIDDDNINSIIGYKYLKKFFISSNISNYHLFIPQLQIKNKIIIIRENNNIYDYTNDTKNIIDNNFNNDYYKFIINNISYLFDIQSKDLKINVNVMETIFQIFRMNSIIYAIIYYNTYNNIDYSKSVINTIYDNLKNYNFDIKNITDKILSHDNVFTQQNDFKLYFNNRINDYNKLYDKNIKHENLIKSKKAYMDTKEGLKSNINIISIIIFFILIFIIFWLIYIIIGNFNQYDAIPHLLIMFIILIIIIFIINYFYNYKEFFTNSTSETVSDLNSIDIFNDTNNYTESEILYNNEKYKITFVNSSSDIILYKNLFTSFVIITKGENANINGTTIYDGTGGTINIYDDEFIANNINENTKYRININNNGYEIILNDLIKSNNRSELDSKDNIKIFYNNIKDINNGNNYKTLKNYVDNINNKDIKIKEILEVLFTNSKNAYFYGSKGNTVYDNNNVINKINYPNSYGLGGVYQNNDKTGNDGVFIIITKESDFSSIHNDLQTLINMYNNNINKLIYDKFNKIYLIDNNVIYNNAFNSFNKKYTIEENKSNNYKLLETDLNEYSNNILVDVFFRYEVAKLMIYIIIVLIFSILFYLFNKEYLLYIIGIFILIVIFLIINFYNTLRRNTRRDYYKYYWSKYNDNYN